MDVHLTDWLSLALRWFHLVAGIAWIGSSFYFVWLDSHLVAPAAPRPGVDGELWMVHSGGFYQVEKRRIGPGQLPGTLHWFKWEAAFTWLSGLALLAVVYYLSGGVFLLDARSPAALTPAVAVGISLGAIGLAWLVYDQLWASRLAARAPRAVTALCFALLVAAVYGLCRIFSGRAAYIHVGGMLGTLMVANVWVRILPAQRQMIAATAAGRQPDLTQGERAKRRSMHNSYMTLPVIFMMISNHYPMTYGHPLAWLVLILMIGLGAGIRHLMILRNKGQPIGVWAAAPVAAAAAALIYMTAPPARVAANPAVAVVSDSEVQAVVAHRCVPCHSAHPTDDVFTVAPNGVLLETPAQLRALAEKVKLRAVVSKTMPLANKTGMTDAERDVLGRWVDGL